MLRALELADLGLGMTSPNPCVGCVIVDESTGRVVGEGWHEKAGEAHAEVRALKDAGDDAAGCTAYVSLEPCNHFGRTPPCTHALLNSGIKRVVTGIVDPDPRVSGKGLEYLRQNGVQVDVGVQEAKCRELNRPFIFRVLNKRSYTTCWLPDESEGLLSVLKDIPLSSPETNMIVIGEDQAMTIMQELGGTDKHAAFADLISSLPTRMTVAIAPIRERKDGDLNRAAKMLVDSYTSRIKRSSFEAPRLLQFTSQECQSLRNILERSLNEGSNAVLLIANSSDELESWCAAGHCQHVKMDGGEERGRESHFAVMREKLRALAANPSCDVASDDKGDGATVVEDERERGVIVGRRKVFGAHIWGR